MVTQTPILLKVDSSLLEELNKECHVSAKKRNAIVNHAIALYLDMADTARRWRCINNPKGKEREERELFRRWGLVFDSKQKYIL